MWRFRKSNGITEGFHRKMKSIQRRAYGFRNFENYRVNLSVVELSGVPFTLHDLRRTFATIAEGLDLSAYALKRLLNHKMNNDVTAGYIMRDVDRLRKPMQQIANFLLNT